MNSFNDCSIIEDEVGDLVSTNDRLTKWVIELLNTGILPQGQPVGAIRLIQPFAATDEVTIQHDFGTYPNVFVIEDGTFDVLQPPSIVVKPQGFNSTLIQWNGFLSGIAVFS
jgi:hypothetical protein